MPNYEIPRYGTSSDVLLQWLIQAVADGQSWLAAQRPARTWQSALDLLSDDEAPAPEGLSAVRYPKVKRTARELVASLASFRHEGEIKTVWNQEYFDQAHTLTNLDRHWYERANANARHREGIQFAIATGTAYFHETWDPHYWGKNMGDVRLQALAPQDVTFLQLPKDHDIQRAYGVLIREEMPINLAKAVYARTNPAFAAGLTPDRQQPGWIAKGLQKLQKYLSPALQLAGRPAGDQDQTSFPTVDIFTLYTNDQSTNDGPLPVSMGVEGTNWSYTVPALGDPLPTDRIDPITKQPLTRSATATDCQMFPFRRRTIFSRTGVCSDGTSPWWHGQAPVARLRFGDWAWEALGSSQVADLHSLQTGIEALMREIEDSMAARLDPPAIWDDTIADTVMQAFNPRKAGARMRAPLSQIDPVKFPYPIEAYNVPAIIPEWIQRQEDRMDYLSGVRDLVAIAKAKQIPGADTLEKLLEMAGPIVQDLVRAVETPLKELGEWRKAYYLQFYTRARMITVTGPEGVPLDTQYYPEQLLPYLMRKNAETGKLERAETEDEHRVRMQAWSGPQRNQFRLQSIDEFEYHVSESGINEIHRMTTKLFYLQLMKLGFPISWWTFARIAQIPNFGPAPEGTNTEMERWTAQKNMEAEMQIELTQKLQGAAGEAPEGPGGLAPPPQDGPGRPPSFSKPPRIQSKDGGSRSTLTTS